MAQLTTTHANPFPFPPVLKPALQRVMSYWESLKRAGNDMPFWDDVKLSALSDLSSQILLLDVFTAPERFRFNVIGQDFLPQASSLQSKFLDEAALPGRLIFLRAQSSATVEASAPTFYSSNDSATQLAFSRILLPMWGDGRLSMLLGAVEAE